MTMMTKFKPDAEGTVFGDYDDEDDESDGTVRGEESATVRIKKEKGFLGEDESLLESLLEGDDSTVG
jgi:hypothetical protein